MSARWKGPSRDHEAAAGTEAGAIRFSTPTAAPPNTRRKADSSERLGASRQKARGFAGTDSGDPRQRGGQLHRSAAKKRPFLLDRSAARFLFGQDRKENGGRNASASILAKSPGRQVAAPTPLRRRAPGGSRFWGVPHSSHSPLWASHQAGKAGSFGERVGLMLPIFNWVEFVLLSKMRTN